MKESWGNRIDSKEQMNEIYKEIIKSSVINAIPGYSLAKIMSNLSVDIANNMMNTSDSEQEVQKNLQTRWLYRISRDPIENKELRKGITKELGYLKDSNLEEAVYWGVQFIHDKNEVED